MIAEGLETFLAARVASHEELQTLLLLCREPDRDWRADQLAAELHIEVELAESALGNLAARGLLASSGKGAESSYRYGAANATDDALCQQLAQAWLEQPLAIIRRLNANAIARTRVQAIKAFADAFIIQKGKKGD